MTLPSDWVESIFHGAREISDPRLRRKYLDDRCQGNEELRDEVESLLRFDSDDSILEHGLAGATPMDEDFVYPDRIGQYRILGILGSGGMGVVYEALQEKPRRKVALKVLRPALMTEKLLRRFEFEAEALGSLHHPGIAQIHAAGMIDTPTLRQPYFAMERIYGHSLATYAKDSTPSIREKLELFLKISDAVHHAHQNGVIHRDLKPDNILVDPEGQPKILDFGIARVAREEKDPAPRGTELGEVIGTLGYMSPEQAGGELEVDIRTDIYSLGVILFELLSGQLPIDLAGESTPNAIRLIQEKEPRRLGSLDRSLKGDLTVIAAKALEKSRGRRYVAVSELAADIRRHLSFQPIEAQPPSSRYLLKKFIRRNRALMLTLSTIVIGLGIGASFGISGLLSARRARDEAVSQRQMTRAAIEVLGRAFGYDNPGHPVPVVAARSYLDHAAREVRRRSQELAGMDATLLRIIGATYRGMGLLEDAVSQLEQASEVSRRTFGREGAETLLIDFELIRAYQSQQRFEEAHELAQLASGASTQVHGSDDELTLSLIEAESEVLFKIGELSQAEERARHVLAKRQNKGDGDPAGLASTKLTLGTILGRRGALDEAHELVMESLRWNRANLGEVDPSTNRCRGTLAHLNRNLGLFSEAERLYGEFLEIEQELYGKEHPRYATALLERADVLNQLRRHTEAEALSREALNILEELHGPESFETVDCLATLAGYVLAVGKHREAEMLSRRAIKVLDKVQTAAPTQRAHCLNALSAALVVQGKTKEAEARIDQSLEIALDVYGDFHPETLTLRQNHARVLTETGRYEDALLVREDVLDAFAEMFGEENIRTSRAHYELGRLLVTMKDYDNATNHIEAAVHGFEARLGEEHKETAVAHYVLGFIRKEQGELPEALELTEKAFRRLSIALGEDHLDVLDAAVVLARLYEQLGYDKECETLLQDQIAAQRDALSPNRQHLRWAEAFLETIQSQAPASVAR